MSTKDTILEPFAYIPYEGPEDDEDDSVDSPVMPTPADFEALDLPDGPRLRLEAFERVWEMYSQRLKEVVSEMHAGVVADAVDAVLDAYNNVSPLLLHTELPVVAVSGPDSRGTTTICTGIREGLCPSTNRKRDGDHGVEDAMQVDQSNPPQALISSIGSSDCVNIMSAMKALIAGFMNNYPLGDEGLAQARKKGSVTSSLVPYDLNMLDAWFFEYKSRIGGKSPPKLVVFVNEFEEAEISVIQDMFYICSLHIPQLPLVFVLSMSSPKEPSFLHAVYPRTTLALLQLKRISWTGGSDSLQTVLLKLLYDSSFDPPVRLGPSTIDFLVEQFLRNSGSIEILSGLLKLVLLQHFMDPFTVFAEDELLGEDSLEDACQLLSEESSAPFVRQLLGRLYHPQKSTLHFPKKKKAWQTDSPNEILDAVREVRATHWKETQMRRGALQVFLLVRDFMLGKGYKTAADGKEDKSVFGMMSACLRGGSVAAKEGNVPYLAKMTRKLSKTQLEELLQALYQFFFNQPHLIRAEEKKGEGDTITPMFVKWMARLDTSGSASDDADASATDFDHATIARELSNWMVGYFEERFQVYTETNLWDIWYTGNPAAIFELTSPAPRVNVIGALIDPARYLEYGDSEKSQERTTVPDTSLLFQRYLESGRMLNVHDWYESFAAALEANRSECGKDKPASKKKSRQGPAARSSASPSKRKGKGKERAVETTPSRRKGRQKAPADSDGDEEIEMDDDAWKLEMQVRFLRSVQELDFMGFLKHTKRKAEHVLKTVFEPPE